MNKKLTLCDVESLPGVALLIYPNWKGKDKPERLAGFKCSRNKTQVKKWMKEECKIITTPGVLRSLNQLCEAEPGPLLHVVFKFFPSKDWISDDDVNVLTGFASWNDDPSENFVMDCLEGDVNYIDE